MVDDVGLATELQETTNNQSAVASVSNAICSFSSVGSGQDTCIASDLDDVLGSARRGPLEDWLLPAAEPGTFAKHGELAGPRAL